MIFNQSISQSFNQNLYIAPSRSLLRGAPVPGQAEKNSLEKVVELRSVQALFRSRLRHIGSPFKVVGPTTDKERNSCKKELSANPRDLRRLKTGMRSSLLFFLF